jgi:F0F1-type ATP synthase membrane subunit c/vacuolar-type H+-ATPase subunit K
LVVISARQSRPRWIKTTILITAMISAIWALALGLALLLFGQVYDRFGTDAR